MATNVTATAAKGATNRTQGRWSLQAAHLFVLPYALLLLIFGVGPGLYALLISFASFQEGRPQLFGAGLKNYVTAYSDFRFLPAFGNVAAFLAISLPIGVVGVVALALLLHARESWLSTAIRTLYFVPGAVAGPTAVLLAIFMFDPNISPFRGLLQAGGYTVVSDVIRPANLPLLFTLLGFFTGAGGWVAIFYGALNSVSREIIEAATIDGCGAWQTAMYIKRPLIGPYIAY
ncbi:MAG: sugar ABC transporter permease, partial [Chloroflexales bacterium]|nr:sugar ABC transporter permease [Chloroflexales bacterium]